MYYTIYKVTNKINGKYYIGKHQTVLLADSYMGSGKYIRRAIEKYGRHNFIKEVLFTFDNEADMNDKEKELVILSEKCYNMTEGGVGGPTNKGRKFPHQWKIKIGKSLSGRKITWADKISKACKGRTPWNKGLSKKDPRVSKNVANWAGCNKGKRMPIISEKLLGNDNSWKNRRKQNGK